jgi:hypothetical protein
MAQDLFPYEIKRFIYDKSSLPEILNLRLASKSWASAGIPSLFLPTFNLRSSQDIDRLREIGSNHATAEQAARIIRALVIPSHGWDPRSFRNIVCSKFDSCSYRLDIYLISLRVHLVTIRSCTVA